MWGAQMAEEEDRDMDVAGWRKAAEPPVPLTPNPLASLPACETGSPPHPQSTQPSWTATVNVRQLLISWVKCY